MTTLKVRESVSDAIYFVMSDQPDGCPQCQSRLDLVEIVMIDEERVFVNFCDDCQNEVLIVEN